MTRVLVAPPVPALLPRYASLVDPIPELRAAIGESMAEFVDGLQAVAVMGDDPFLERVAQHLLLTAGFTGQVRGDADDVLVLANGSACRGEKAPGHLDDRAFAFDDAVGAALRSGRGPALFALDTTLATDLWTSGIPALQRLGEDLGSGWKVTEYYDGDPYGVRWWVTSWSRTH